MAAIDAAHLDAFKQSYSEQEQNLARVKLAFVERMEQLPLTKDIACPVIKELWADARLWGGKCLLDKPPHFTTVARWISAYRKSGRDIRSLINRHQSKGNCSERVHPIVRDFTDDLIQTRYLTEERPTLKTILQELKGHIALRNTTRVENDKLHVPAYAYLKRRIQELAPYDVYRARFGQRAADLKFRASGRGAIAAHPLARASMDHCRMDVFVVDERTRLPLGRPWLTVVLDEYSRYVLGYYISFEEPSSVSMTRALRHALAVKEPSDDARESWDAWGIMETLVVDNGLEFHARALEAGAGRFGITIQFCPRRKPWYKGKIERFFGTMNTGLLNDLKGKTFSNIVLKGDYDPAKHAVLTLRTLRRIVHTWIVDVYHQEIHSGLKTSPAQAWNEGLHQVDRYLPPSSIVVESAFSTSGLRKLTHKGIEFDLLFYNSNELRAIRNLHGSDIDVEVRTHDDDLGSLVVVAPDGRTLVKVPAINSEYADGLTRWQHAVCKRFQRRTQDDDAREISLLEARNRIRALIEEDMHLSSRGTRKAQQRFIQREPGVEQDLGLGRSSEVAETSSADSIPMVEGGIDSAAKTNDVRFDEEAVPEFPSRRTASGGRR